VLDLFFVKKIKQKGFQILEKGLQVKQNAGKCPGPPKELNLALFQG
jgi:hypothetical protein